MISRQIVIIGAGAAGLAAAYELCNNQVPCLLLEQENKPGGIARTESFNNYYFDLGGHRFFSKAEEINRIWHEVLPHDFLVRSRLSRVYYRHKFFNYPLKPFNALTGLGLWESFSILGSYIKQRLFPYPEENTFEQWVSNRFGQRLYEIFFKSYTEKVWGISCQDISAEWAAQRIQGLSLTSALKNALFGGSGKDAKTLISTFEYPKYGPGQMWTAMIKLIENFGGKFSLGDSVIKVIRGMGTVNRLGLASGREIETSQLITSMPLRDLILMMEPAPPAAVVEAARSLKYRQFLIVALIINQAAMFPDNWIYIHSPEVKLGRIQNFKNWSPAMVPDQSKTCLGLEYFCDYQDALWNAADQELIELGKRELRTVGLLDDLKKVEQGTVLRVKNAYPVYDRTSSQAVKTIKTFLATIKNLQTIGRTGLHRYNNMDHSMLTGLFAARNLLGQGSYDLWSVNADQEYHEETTLA